MCFDISMVTAPMVSPKLFFWLWHIFWGWVFCGFSRKCIWDGNRALKSIVWKAPSAFHRTGADVKIDYANLNNKFGHFADHINFDDSGYIGHSGTWIYPTSDKVNSAIAAVVADNGYNDDDTTTNTKMIMVMMMASTTTTTTMKMMKWNPKGMLNSVFLQ